MALSLRSAPRRRFSPPGGSALAAAALLLVLCAGSARAALFEDDEARKAILDLRSRVQASDDGAKARLDQLSDGNAQLRRSLLDLNAQLEQQRAESAKLRGDQEQLARDLAELQRLVKDLSKALDDRLRVIEPQKVTLDGKEFLADPGEIRAQEQAMALLRGGDFDKAGVALAGFLQRYPASGYADSTRFWLGNALYGQKNYKDAIAAFRSLINSAPGHPRVPEALLAVANCQIEMKDGRSARKTLDELIKSFPASEAAAAGQERLRGLKG